MADRAIVDRALATAPKDYVVAANVVLALKAVSAIINGSASSGTFLPAVQLVAPDGTVMWTAVPPSPIAAGESAVMSWFPGGGVEEAAESSTPTAGGIARLGSSAGTLTVSNPTGPTANVDMPTTGVSPGGYGSSTQVPAISVDAEGRITGASNVSISGISGTGLVKLFDSTLGVAAASIDTGAGGVAAGHDCLVIVAMLQSAAAAAQRVALMRFNNDSGANYDRQFAGGFQTTASLNASAAGTGCTFLMHGNAGSTSYPGVAVFTVPAYDKTTFWKVLTGTAGVIDATTSNNFLTTEVQGWRSTAAISRVSVQDQSGGNLSAGSRLIVYGTQ